MYLILKYLILKADLPVAVPDLEPGTACALLEVSPGDLETWLQLLRALQAVREAVGREVPPMTLEDWGTEALILLPEAAAIGLDLEALAAQGLTAVCSPALTRVEAQLATLVATPDRLSWRFLPPDCGLPEQTFSLTWQHIAQLWLWSQHLPEDALD